jgi:hypothetical protein
MSLTAFALVNGILAGALLTALAYVCLVPFRLDRTERTASSDVVVPQPDYAYEQAAA